MAVMNAFSIKDIENLTSIKAHTWRMWESRYNIGIPQRKDSNHRFYDNDDLKEILKISYLYHAGYKISTIAALKDAERIRLVEDKSTFTNERDFLIKEMLEASIDLDEDRFNITFKNSCNQLGLENTLTKVVYPFQQKIGVLWLTEHVIPSQEHFTSNIIRQKICTAIDELPLVRKESKPSILLFTPEKEMHEIPLLLMHYLLKKHGFKTIYLGSNISLHEVELYANKNPDCTHVLFYLATNLNSWSPENFLSKLCKSFSAKTIMMAGKYVMDISTKPANAMLLHHVEDAMSFCIKNSPHY